ncbi:cytosine deaminase [Klebsiella pneumoniae]|uniref:Cytosine deaminase n=1 Tax=Klebsiella pneumoniae TaxID=573 RepID=A0A3S4GL89_KLEPN|nr:cytosine deaminase [Klebsiella pneumoniae]
MKIINARLRRQEALFTLDLQDGMIHRITAQAAMQTGRRRGYRRPGPAGDPALRRAAYPS